jgi:hypothetical protein
VEVAMFTTKGKKPSDWSTEAVTMGRGKNTRWPVVHRRVIPITGQNLSKKLIT